MADRDKLLKRGLEDRILPTTEEPSLHKKRLIQGGLGIQLGFFFFFFWMQSSTLSIHWRLTPTQIM